MKQSKFGKKIHREIRIMDNVQSSANQINKLDPYRTLQMGPAYSSGLAQTVYIYKIQK